MVSKCQGKVSTLVFSKHSKLIKMWIYSAGKIVNDIKSFFTNVDPLLAKKNPLISRHYR